MSEQPSDNEILKLLQTDPEKGFKWLFEKYQQFRFVDKLVLDAQLPEFYIEDIKAEMLFALFHNVTTGKLRELKGKFSTYLYAIAHHLLVSKIRALKRDDQLRLKREEEEIPDFEWPPMPDETLDTAALKLKSCLENIPLECRKLLKQRFGGNLNHEALKELFGFASKEVARQRVYKCLDHIRKCVKPSSDMDQDEATKLELLRRFLDNDLSDDEKATVEDLIREDPKARDILEEEIALRKALGDVFNHEIAALARATVAHQGEQRGRGGASFWVSPKGWLALAAAVFGLIAGLWWFFSPGQAEQDRSFGFERDHTLLFSQELPVFKSLQNPVPSGRVLSVALIETSALNASYILEGEELWIESPPGFWNEPIAEVAAFEMETPSGVLLRVNSKIYQLESGPMQKKLPPPIQK